MNYPKNRNILSSLLFRHRGVHEVDEIKLPLSGKIGGYLQESEREIDKRKCEVEVLIRMIGVSRKMLVLTETTRCAWQMSPRRMRSTYRTDKAGRKGSRKIDDFRIPETLLRRMRGRKVRVVISDKDISVTFLRTKLRRQNKLWQSAMTNISSYEHFQLQIPVNMCVIYRY